MTIDEMEEAGEASENGVLVEKSEEKRPCVKPSL
jgi:hypothetical protein